MRKHSTFIITTVGFIVFFLIVGAMVRTRTPDELGPVGVGIFFMLIYGLLAQAISLAIVIYSYVRGAQLMPLQQRAAVSLGSALPIIMLLALNTIRQITIIDLFLAIIFGMVLVFYLRRR